MKKYRFDPEGSIRQLINPGYVAYVGLSQNKQKVGFRIGSYVASSRFRGSIAYVSPSRELFGQETFPSLASVPGVPDCVVIAVPASAVLRVITEAAQKGVGAAVILTSGFSEIGPEGEVLQRRLKQIVDESGMRVCGPNSLGVINFHSGFVASFSQGLDYKEIEPGPVAVVTQSGFVGSVLFVSIAQEGWGPSLYVSVGNEIDVDLADALSIARQDVNTRLIVCYLEGIRNGRKLLEEASACVREGKPVVVLRGGKSVIGRKAALSHTAAIAPESTIVAAALRRCGAIEVEDEEEVVDFVRLYLSLGEKTKLLKSKSLRKCGIVTLSGGLGIVASDLLTKHGFEVPKISEGVRKQVAELLPPFAITYNPVDVTGNAVAEPELFGKTLSVLGKSGEVDCVIVILGMLRGRETLLLEQTRNSAIESRCPVLGIWLAIKDSSLKGAQGAGVVWFRHTGAAIRALSLFRDWFVIASDVQDYGVDDDYRVVGFVGDTDKRRVLDEYSSKGVLRSAGIVSPPSFVVGSREEAVEASKELGFPIVMKVIAEGIAHKSDIGGVLTGIRSLAEVEAAFERLVSLGHSANEKYEVNGLLLEKEEHDGVELLVGARRDPQFGVATTVGLGGIYTELFRESAVTVVGSPSKRMLLRELAKVSWYSLLQGWRGQAKRDVEALWDTCHKVWRLLAKDEAIDEVEINPLLVHSRGDGAVALDAVVVTRGDITEK